MSVSPAEFAKSTARRPDGGRALSRHPHASPILPGPHPERVVVCWLLPDVFPRVRAALLEQGLQAVPTPTDEMPTNTPRRQVVGMIYDLGVTGNQNAVDVIYRLWSLYPGRPVLLCYEPNVATASLVGQLARLRGVVAWARVSNPTDEARQLGKLAGELFASAPSLRLRALLNEMHPKMPIAPFATLEALLDRLEQGGDGAPMVSELARKAGFNLWQVRHACRIASLPAPQLLVEWVTLIYVIALADRDNKSVARAAADAGVTEKHIRTLRARLLPEIQRLSRSLAHGVLPHAIAKFAEACGLPDDRAAAAAEHLLR